MNEYLDITKQNEVKRKFFLTRLKKYITEEASQRLWWGSCMITMKKVVQRMCDDKEIDFNINLSWPSGRDISNVDKHIQFLDKMTKISGTGVIKIKPAGGLSVHREAQRVANAGNLVLIINANYYYSDRPTKRKGQHHGGILIEDTPATDNPMMGQGGVREKGHIFGRAYTWMQWFKKNDRGISNRETTVYFLLKGTA